MIGTDSSQPAADSEKTEKQAKKKNINLNNLPFRRFAIFLIPIIVLGVVFILGSSYGSNKQKKKITSNTVAKKADQSGKSKSWSVVGHILDINGQNINIKGSNSKQQKVTINDKTVIIDKTGKKVDTKSLKKDQKVVVSGTKESNGSQSATRMRIMQ